MNRSRVFKQISNLFYPVRCPYCNCLIEHGEPFCKQCSIVVPKKFYNRTIGQTVQDKPIICVAPLLYRDRVIEAIWRFKFRGYKVYAPQLAIKMAECVTDQLEDCLFDVITSVPLSLRRRISRGYNQAELLAKETGDLLGISYQMLLCKKKHNLEQHKLSVEEREKNVIGVYSPKNACKIENQRILLCDDVVTTGNTLKECAKVLYQSGAKEVCCLALASAF